MDEPANERDVRPSGDAGPPAAQRGEESLGDLVRRLSELTAELVRQELALARTEVTGRARRTGAGAALVAAGSLLGLFALGCVLAAAIILIAAGLEAWIAAVIVAAAVAGLAGMLALAGRSRVRRAVPPVPQRAVGAFREDVEALREGSRRS